MFGVETIKTPPILGISAFLGLFGSLAALVISVLNWYRINRLKTKMDSMN